MKKSKDEIGRCEYCGCVVLPNKWGFHNHCKESYAKALEDVEKLVELHLVEKGSYPADVYEFSIDFVKLKKTAHNQSYKKESDE